MKNIEISEKLLDTSYMILYMSGIKTEYDQAVFDCVNEVCKANGVSFRKYMTMLSEINRRLKELGEE